MLFMCCLEGKEKDCGAHNRNSDADIVRNFLSPLCGREMKACIQGSAGTIIVSKSTSPSSFSLLALTWFQPQPQRASRGQLSRYATVLFYRVKTCQLCRKAAILPHLLPILAHCSYCTLSDSFVCMRRPVLWVSFHVSHDGALCGAVADFDTRPTRAVESPKACWTAL